MKILIQNYIIWCAHKKIKHTTAQIIAITGSVGKSTTKEAITQVLSSSYKVRSNYGSLNNELGLPLAIMGEKNGTSLVSWLWKVIRITWKTFIADSKIEIFVLECGIDKAGDMDVITSLVKPHIAVITTVESVHTQNFGSFEELVKEKWKLAQATQDQATVIANFDNPHTTNEVLKLPGREIITFGLNAKANIYGHGIQFNLQGTSFEANFENEDHHIQIPILGKASIYSTLPAIAIARKLNISWDEITTQLQQLKPLPGRLTPLAGINGSTLLEGSYNASPASMKMAIEVLKIVPAKRRIAIVGDMRELGDITAEAHHDILNQLGTTCDLVITLGPNYLEALKHLPAHKHNQASFQGFDNREDLIQFIVPKISPEDVILIKGSQNTIMLEKVSIKLMADPSQAKAFLPRQYGKWKKL